MPALDLAGLDERLSNLLKLESALTDVLCVVGAITLIEPAGGGAFDKDAVLSTLGKSFGIGLLYGVLGGLLWIVLHRLWGGSKRVSDHAIGALDALCGDLARWRQRRTRDLGGGGGDRQRPLGHPAAQDERRSRPRAGRRAFFMASSAS